METNSNFITPVTTVLQLVSHRTKKPNCSVFSCASEILLVPSRVVSRRNVQKLCNIWTTLEPLETFWIEQKLRKNPILNPVTSKLWSPYQKWMKDFLNFLETVQTAELRSQIVKPVGPKCYYSVRGKDAAAFCSCPSIFSFWQKWPLYVSIGFYFKALLLRCAFQPFLYILFFGDDWVFARFLAHLHRTNSFGYLPHFRMELRPCAHKMGRKQ